LAKGKINTTTFSRMVERSSWQHETTLNYYTIMKGEKE